MAKFSILHALFPATLLAFAGCANPQIEQRPHPKFLNQRAATTPATPPFSSPRTYTPQTDVAVSHSTMTAPERLGLDVRLAKRSVTDDRFAVQDLYSWTTPDQASALRKTKVLLVATAKSRGAPSPYSRLLSRLAADPGQTAEIAKLFVDHPGLSKRRYAWPSPFATAVPLGERSYGHVLVRIVLKPEAFLAKLDPLEEQPFGFVDMKNVAVPVAEVLLHPERIAAVFHVRRSPDGGPKFREYIVCNEAMVARWSLGTSHEQAVVDAEAALMAELEASSLVSALTNEQPINADAAWAKFADKPSLLDAWRAAIAFDSPKYKPSRTTLDAIAISLAAYDPAGEGIDHVPTIAFPDKL